jgi:hypothetical protein
MQGILKTCSACAAGIIKTPLQWHFFDDADSTGKHAWYYGWQMYAVSLLVSLTVDFHAMSDKHYQH